MTGTEAISDCVFCGIVAERLPASQVYADADVIAFLDISPVTTGHLLVLPRAHVASLDELDDQIGERVFTTARRLAKAIRGSSLPCEGINLFLADGAVAGQDVFHVHLHVVPRTAGDGFRITARRQQPNRSDLDAAAAAIRAGLNAASP